MHVCCSVKPDNKNVIDILRVMTNTADIWNPLLPDHPLFKTQRWNKLFCMSSHYFVPTSIQQFEYNHISDEWSLVTYASIKNYDNEIEKFFDWIRPYLASSVGDFIGYSQSEYDDAPTLYFA